MQQQPKPLLPDSIVSVKFDFDPFGSCATDVDRAQVVLKVHSLWCQTDIAKFLKHRVLEVDLNRNGMPAVLVETKDTMFWQCYAIGRRSN